MIANKLITKVNITKKVNLFLRLKYQRLLGSKNIFLSIKLITKNKIMWIAIFISWFEKKSKIKEKTGIQTLKINNKLRITGFSERGSAKIGYKIFLDFVRKCYFIIVIFQLCPRVLPKIVKL